MNLTDKAVERFLGKFIWEQNDCWEWTDKPRKDGYGAMQVGRLGIDRRPQLAHRISWEIFKGPIPEGMQVLHRCDNPKCVNPGHFFLGENIDNRKDSVSKGRHCHGENHNFNKLSEYAVRQILTSKSGNAVLGRRFGVTRGCIWNIRNGRTWNHLKEKEN